MASWFIFALLYPLCYSIINIIDKFLIEKKIKNFYAYGVVFGALILCATFIIILINGFPELTPSLIFFSLISGFSYGIVYLIYFYLLKSTEVSRIISIGYLFPAFVALLSRIFLSEELSFIKYGAVLIAICGALLLGTEKKKHQWKITNVFWLMVLNAFLIAVVDVSDKYIVDRVTLWHAYILTTLPFCITLMMPLLYKKVRSDVPQVLSRLPFLVTDALLTLAGVLSFFMAAAQAPITIVSALGTLQPVFVFLFALVSSVLFPRFLKEQISKKILLYKITGMIAIISATIILILW